MLYVRILQDRAEAINRCPRRTASSGLYQLLSLCQRQLMHPSEAMQLTYNEHYEHEWREAVNQRSSGRIARPVYGIPRRPNLSSTKPGNGLRLRMVAARYKALTMLECHPAPLCIWVVLPHPIKIKTFIMKIIIKSRVQMTVLQFSIIYFPVSGERWIGEQGIGVTTI